MNLPKLTLTIASTLAAALMTLSIEAAAQISCQSIFLSEPTVVKTIVETVRSYEEKSFLKKMAKPMQCPQRKFLGRKFSLALNPSTEFMSSPFYKLLWPYSRGRYF